jgi:iron complex outermembrane receptor protein
MRNSTVSRLLAATSLACLVGVIAPPVYAQDQSDNQDAETRGGLTEIVVTAQKRTENLQDVPVAVSAVNAEQIESSFSRDISEIAALSPNLVIDPLYGVASASIGIRGIQLNDGEKSFDPAVAVYLDGVYLATNTGALLNTFDAEAVEVLRGPQGTLFGRNTIGGLVHLRRKEPTGELGGKVVATYGRFDQFDVKGVLNLPSIADGAISAKVGVVSLNGGGYFKNVTRGVTEGDNDFMMYSAGLKIEPSPFAKLVVFYDYIDDKTNTRPVTALTAQGEAFCFGVFGPIDGCGRPMSDADFHRRPNLPLCSRSPSRATPL